MARTTRLPGVSVENPELTKLAEEYVDKRDERMAVGKQESALKQQLIAMMRVLKLRTYFDQEANLSIVLESKTSVKVKVGGDERLHSVVR